MPAPTPRATTTTCRSCNGSKYSLFVENTNADQTLGFVLGGVHSDTNIRTDSLNAYNQNIYGPTSYPYPTGPNLVPPPGSVPLVATPCCITFGSIFDDKKRDALTGSLEWRPSETFTCEGGRPVDPAQRPADRLQRVVLLPGQSRRHALGEQRRREERRHYRASPSTTSSRRWSTTPLNRQVTTWLYGLNASWKPIDRLTIAIGRLPLDREPPRGRRGHVRDRGPGERLPHRGGHPQFRRRAEQPAEHQCRDSAEPAGPHDLSRGHRQQDECGLLLLHGADELGVPQQQQVLVDALRGAERLLGARSDHGIHAGRCLGHDMRASSTSCSSARGYTTATRTATTAATTGPTARASTARSTRRPAAPCSATRTRSARRGSTSSRW